MLYQLYGLTIQSNIPLMGAPASRLLDSNPIKITLEHIPTYLPDTQKQTSFYQTADDGQRILVTVPNIARYLIEYGNTIRIEPAQGIDQESIVAFLLTTPIALLLQQRGRVSLQASVIGTPQGALIFVGSSGSGKSLMAAAFSERGFSLIADEIAAIDLAEDGKLVVYPAISEIAMWRQAYELVAGDEPLQPVRRVRPRLEKFAYGVQHFEANPQIIRKIYFVNRLKSGSIDIQPVSQIVALPLISQAIYQTQINGTKTLARCWDMIGQLLQIVPMAQISRVGVPFSDDKLIERLEMDELG